MLCLLGVTVPVRNEAETWLPPPALAFRVSTLSADIALRCVPSGLHREGSRRWARACGKSNWATSLPLTQRSLSPPAPPASGWGLLSIVFDLSDCGRLFEPRRTEPFWRVETCSASNGLSRALLSLGVELGSDLICEKDGDLPPLL